MRELLDALDAFSLNVISKVYGLRMDPSNDDAVIRCILATFRADYMVRIGVTQASVQSGTCGMIAFDKRVRIMGHKCVGVPVTTTSHSLHGKHKHCFMIVDEAHDYG